MTQGGDSVVLATFVSVAASTLYLLLRPTVYIPYRVAKILRIIPSHAPPLEPAAEARELNTVERDESPPPPPAAVEPVDSSVPIEFAFWIPSVLGVLFLWMTTLLPSRIIWIGIAGDQFIQPYAILIFFMTQAYLCINLDATGIFAWIAKKLAIRAKNSGFRAFLFYYIMSSVLTVLTSNDIVVLTLTPILVHFTNLTGLDVLPFLLAEFFSLNLWSAALLTGNPTNIIVADAFDLSFAEFFRWMFLPTVLSGIVLFLVVYALFRKKVNVSFRLDHMDEQQYLDKSGAIFGFVVLIACLICLSVAPKLGLHLYQVTLIFSLVCFVRELIVYFLEKDKGIAVIAPVENVHDEQVLHEGETKSVMSSSIEESKKAMMPPRKSLRSVFKVVMGLPWAVAPFVISMFILVEGLDYTGWVDICSSAFASIANSNSRGAMFLIGVIAIILGNVLNNQPMTILMTKVLLKAHLLIPNEKTVKMSAYSLIFGTNVTANLTISGALAGILWMKVLQSKQVHIKGTDLLKNGLITAIAETIVFLLILLAEFS
jgi:arsenical pump membrane protein